MVVTGERDDQPEAGRRTFSPLYVGSVVVTLALRKAPPSVEAFSPLYVGSVVVTIYEGRDIAYMSVPFSPLYVGSVVVTLLHCNCNR